MRNDTRLWHPFAAMGRVRSGELVITRGEDVWVWDDQGNRYVDSSAVQVSANIGHGRPEVADAVAAQMKRIESFTSFGNYATEPTLELADRLCELAPMDDPRVLLGSGGSDGIETSAKLARRYWTAMGQPERVHLINRTGAFHGMHGFGTSIAGIAGNRNGLGPLMADCSSVEWNSVDALAEEVERIGAEHVAAFYVEPVMGAGGFLAPPEGYLEGVSDLCHELGILLVVDSVVCGFGRLGSWFGVERWPGLKPDMIVFAKGVTSGYLPLGGVMVDQHVTEPFWSTPDAPMFAHGVTYSGHATCCAAALAVIGIIERDGLLERSRALEQELATALAPLAAHQLVREVRVGTGVLAGVELEPDFLLTRPNAVEEAALVAREHEVLIRPQPKYFPIAPPLTATGEHLELIAEAVKQGCDSLLRTA